MTNKRPGDTARQPEEGEVPTAITLPARRSLAVLLVLLGLLSLCFGGAMDWGMAGLFWVLSAVCFMIAWHLRHDDQLWFAADSLFQQHGKRVQRVAWPSREAGELRLIPMGGFNGLLLIDDNQHEYPLCTWRRQITCVDLARHLNEVAPHALRITNLDGDKHEFARLRRQQAEIETLPTTQNTRDQSG